MRRECRERFPRHREKAIPTCITARAWCMPGSLTSGFLWSRRRGKAFPAFPAHAQSAIIPFHKDSSPSGEQLEHSKLAHELQQPTVGCIAIFKKKIGAIHNVAVLQQIWPYKIIRSTLPMCPNITMWVNGAWIKRYGVLCSKTYNTFHSCHNFPAGSRQAARDARICETSLFYVSGKRPILLSWFDPHFKRFRYVYILYASSG